MPFLPHISSFRIGRRLLVWIALGLGATACSRSAPPADSAATEAPPAGSQPAAPDLASGAESAPPPPVADAVPSPRPPPVAVSDTPADLESRYFSTAITPEERSDLLQRLGSLGTPPAAEVLGRIFQTEKRLEPKMQAFQVLYDLPDETCREQKFATLQRAVAPSMSQLIRLGAVQNLADFDDPRVPAALRALTSDRDPVIRKQAAEVLHDRSP